MVRREDKVKSKKGVGEWPHQPHPNETSPVRKREIRGRGGPVLVPPPETFLRHSRSVPTSGRSPTSTRIRKRQRMTQTHYSVRRWLHVTLSCHDYGRGDPTEGLSVSAERNRTGLVCVGLRKKINLWGKHTSQDSKRRRDRTRKHLDPSLLTMGVEGTVYK